MASLSPILSEVISAGGSVQLTVTGNSMRPMLRHRVSHVKLSAVHNPRVGDVPLYRRDNGAFVLHRIVRADGDSFTMCGDNQWQLEKGIRRDQLIAVITDFSRDGIHWCSCSHSAYAVYWKFWVGIRPLRHLLIGGYRRARRFGGRLLRKLGLRR